MRFKIEAVLPNIDPIAVFGRKIDGEKLDQNSNKGPCDEYFC